MSGQRGPRGGLKPLRHHLEADALTLSPFTFSASEASRELIEPNICINTKARKGPLELVFRNFRIQALFRFPCPGL